MRSGNRSILVARRLKRTALQQQGRATAHPQTSPSTNIMEYNLNARLQDLDSSGILAGGEDFFSSAKGSQAFPSRAPPPPSLHPPGQSRGYSPRPYGYPPSTDFEAFPSSFPPAQQAHDAGRLPVNIVLPNGGIEAHSLMILSNKVERLESTVHELQRSLVQSQEENKTVLQHFSERLEYFLSLVVQQEQPSGETPDKLLPTLPGVSARPPPSRTSHQSSLYSSRQLSPISEVPHPSELQTLQLEIDILNQELAAARQQSEGLNYQVASLKKEAQQYLRQIDRQNHLVAQIANTIELVFSEYRVAAERFQQAETAPPEMAQAPRQGWI
ncbi:hypothetical protein GQ53DRAFT_814365 [Thozetella sp. PMI_491]|nr:hypothetical protein GQ53DRAFT_814365 [Thozetella sp. PMI_491]